MPLRGTQGAAVVPAAVTDVVVEAWGEEERGLEKEVPHWVFWAWILLKPTRWTSDGANSGTTTCMTLKQKVVYYLNL